MLVPAVCPGFSAREESFTGHVVDKAPQSFESTDFAFTPFACWVTKPDEGRACRRVTISHVSLWRSILVVVVLIDPTLIDPNFPPTESSQVPESTLYAGNGCLSEPF